MKSKKVEINMSGLGDVCRKLTTLHDIGLLLYPLMSQRSPFPENRLEKRKHALKFSYNEDPKTNSRIELGSGLKLKASFSIRYIR